MIIPIVVILVAGIIDSHLNAVVIRSRGGHNGHRSRKESSQYERTDVTMCKAHMKILQVNSAISVLERREAKVNFLILPSGTVLVFPSYPFVEAS